jgi:hypothetical protein
MLDSPEKNGFIVQKLQIYTGANTSSTTSRFRPEQGCAVSLSENFTVEISVKIS